MNNRVAVNRRLASEDTDRQAWLNRISTDRTTANCIYAEDTNRKANQQKRYEFILAQCLHKCIA